MTETTRQTSIQPFTELNRYDGRDADWPSDEVFTPPRRTLSNWWAKFHATRDCGRRNVRFVEQIGHTSTSEKYHYDLVCWTCGHKIDEDEVLFIGGDWWNEYGWQLYGRGIDSLWLPPERVLELGPDPDESELKRALNLTRIEGHVGPHVGGPIRPEQWSECEDCGHAVPLLFDDRCRMCYDGEWTDRMMNGVIAYEQKVREWHNNSFRHRLENEVDPMTPGDGPGQYEVLWRRHDIEGTTKLVIVTKRLEDRDDDHREYEIADPTYTEYWQYREEDLADCFWSTGLYDKHHKGTSKDDIRAAYQWVCDHSFNEVHDSETMEPVGEQCIHCRLMKGETPEVVEYGI